MALFITVEGPNGAGKTTTVNALEKKLSLNCKVYTTKEPSPTDFGNYVKKNEGSLTSKAYAHLIAADRCYHVENFIMPALNNYDIVLCDRYIESSLVLQHFDNVGLDYIWKLNEDFVIPDLSIILISDSNILENRLKLRDQNSDFELKISRKREIELYLFAYDYILSKGFNPIYLNSATEDMVDMNVSRILSEIDKLREISYE